MKDWRIYLPKPKEEKENKVNWEIYKNNNFIYKRKDNYLNFIYKNSLKDDKKDDYTKLIPWQTKKDFEVLDIESNKKFKGDDFNIIYNMQLDFIKGSIDALDKINNIIKLIKDMENE